MRSPVGELLGAGARALTRLAARPRNDAPVPYVGRGGAFAGHLAGGEVTGDPTAAIEAPGSNGTLFSIMNQLSTATAAVRWHMDQYTGNENDVCDKCDGDDGAGYRCVDRHPALVVWNKPNDHFTQTLFVESFEQHLDLVGEAWWVVGYLMGKPVELWPVRPDRMAPVRDRSKFIAGYVYRSPDGQLVPLGVDEVVFLRQPAPWDVYRGAGAVQTLLTKLYGQRYAAEWNTNFFLNSARPDGVIEMPVHLPDTQWNEFQQRWQETHKGVRNAHTVAVLEHGAKWVDTNMSMRDMEFPELNKVSREETREAFAIHPSILGLSESVNRANAEAAEYGHMKRLIVPRLERIRDGLNGPFLKLFGPGLDGEHAGYRFSFANPVPNDRAADDAERTSKTQAWSTLVQAGADPAWAAEVCGLPEPVMAPTPAAPAALPPGQGQQQPSEMDYAA